MIGSVFLFVVGLASLAIFYALWQPSITHDASEPPLVPSKIPFVGHLIGLFRHGLAYYTLQSHKHKLPIFTINLLSSKVYVVTSPALVAAVQRKSRFISFEPFPTIAAERVAGIKGPGLKLLRETRAGGGGLSKSILHIMSPTLLKDGLDRMNSGMVTTLKTSIDKLANEVHHSFDLYAWCRRVLTIASTDAVYGPLNPYKSPSIQEAVWTYERSAAIFMLNLAPQLIANQAWRSREMLVAAFEEYYQKNGHINSSEVTYQRWKVQHENGASLSDIARLEALLAFALLPNSVPSTFWLIVEICSRPDLLAEVREELRQNALLVDKDGVHWVDLGGIQSRCGLLVSVFQETLRLRSNATVIRKVYEDVILNDQYLLKAGSLLQMPAAHLGQDESTWGVGAAQAKEFDPRRFIRHKNSSAHQAATGYLAFGAAPGLCPGRHFATGEILALTAMMLLRYDIRPESRQWTVSQLDLHDMPATVNPPCMGTFYVTVTPRKDWDSTVEWGFQVAAGYGKYGLVTG